MASDNGKSSKSEQPFDQLARILQSEELTKSEFTEVDFMQIPCIVLDI